MDNLVCLKKSVSRLLCCPSLFDIVMFISKHMLLNRSICEAMSFERLFTRPCSSLDSHTYLYREHGVGGTICSEEMVSLQVRNQWWLPRWSMLTPSFHYMEILTQDLQQFRNWLIQSASYPGALVYYLWFTRHMHNGRAAIITQSVGHD